MYSWANQFPQLISLTTKKRSAQVSMVAPHQGRNGNQIGLVSSQALLVKIVTKILFGQCTFSKSHQTTSLGYSLSVFNKNSNLNRLGSRSQTTSLKVHTDKYMRTYTKEQNKPKQSKRNGDQTLKC